MSYAIETIKEQVVLNQAGLLADDTEWSAINTITSITPRIFCSGYGPAQSPPILTKYNIRGVLTVGDMKISEMIIENYKKLKISHIVIPLEDIMTADITQHFDTIYNFISQLTSNDYNIIVHDDQGISRAPAAILYYLVAKLYKQKGKPKEPATKSIYEHIKGKRTCIDINPGFLTAIENEEKKLRA